MRVCLRARVYHDSHSNSIIFLSALLIPNPNRESLISAQLGSRLSRQLCRMCVICPVLVEEATVSLTRDCGFAYDFARVRRLSFARIWRSGSFDQLFKSCTQSECHRIVRESSICQRKSYFISSLLFSTYCARSLSVPRARARLSLGHCLLPCIVRIAFFPSFFLSPSNRFTSFYSSFFAFH